MEYTELTGKTREELLVQLAELQGKFDQLRFDLTDKKVKDTSQFGKIKRDIARIRTALQASHQI